MRHHKRIRIRCRNRSGCSGSEGPRSPAPICRRLHWFGTQPPWTLPGVAMEAAYFVDSTLSCTHVCSTRGWYVPAWPYCLRSVADFCHVGVGQVGTVQIGASQIGA